MAMATVHEFRPRVNHNTLGGPRVIGPPQPIPKGMPAVMKFSRDMVPESIGAWVMDIARRFSCPPDYVAATAVCALGSVLGRKVAIRPQKNTPWSEVANLWGIVIGEPGSLKTPAMDEAMRPLKKLEDSAWAKFKEESAEYAKNKENQKVEKGAANKRTNNSILSGEEPNPLEELEIIEPNVPTAKRYTTNDSTYEMLGKLLLENPNGLLVFRDEVVSLLKYLDQEEHASAKSFFLSAWGGQSSYTFDRIGRGTLHIPSICLSVFGSSQPGKIREYTSSVIAGGAKNDGMMQRFQLLVWPDEVSYQNVDQFPDKTAQNHAFEAFKRLDDLDVENIGAIYDSPDEIPYLRFTDEARDMFVDWRDGYEVRKLSLGPAMGSHLSKYRSLVLGLALINHLADGGSGPVDGLALARALLFTEYLESHARRAYGAGQDTGTEAARAILGRFASGGIQWRQFTLRDILRKNWTALSDRAQVISGLELLEDLDWIYSHIIETGHKGGRPKREYVGNSQGVELWAAASKAD